MAGSFFVAENDDVFVSTKWTRGPWGPDSQHAGPPAALLGRAIERVGDRDDMHVARITFEILRPVPIERLSVSARVVRPGRSVEMIEGALSIGSEDVMRARAWRIRRDELDLDPTPRPDPPPMPAESASRSFPTGYDGYLQAMEWRFAYGHFSERGPAAAWARMRIPLVEGQEIDPLARVLVLADSGNGISSVLDFNGWIFINTDLTVYLHRPPVGEWVCLEAETIVEPSGVGLAASTLHDGSGPIGRGLQALFVAPANG